MNSFLPSLTNDQLTNLEGALAGLLSTTFQIARKETTAASAAPALANNLEQTAAVLGHPMPSTAQGAVSFLLPLAAYAPALFGMGKAALSIFSSTGKGK